MTKGFVVQLGAFSDQLKAKQQQANLVSNGFKAYTETLKIDNNEEMAARVQAYFNEHEKAAQLKLVLGNALEVIPNLQQTFDLVFIDADKKNYSNYYHLIFDKVNPGGYIIADNVLWSGKVVQATQEKDADTLAMKAYNEMVAHDSRVEPLLLPLRDGLMICKKK